MPLNPKNIHQTNRIQTCGKKKLPYVPNKGQIIKILQNTSDIRLAMTIFIGCLQGLRIGEIVRLDWANVDLINGELKVIDGKNTRRYKSGYGKDRIVPINDMFIDIWAKYKKICIGHEHVIPVRNKVEERNEKRLIRLFQEKLKNVLKDTGLLEVDFLQKNNSPRYKFHMHSFRHVCGTNLRRAGLKIEDVRDFLGHDDVETTQVYVELTKDDLKQISNKAYAYPKSHLGIPDAMPIQVSMDKETMQLQKEILEKQIELARINIEAKAKVMLCEHTSE